VELDAGEPIPDLMQYDLLVAMGGPMDVWQYDCREGCHSPMGQGTRSSLSWNLSGTSTPGGSLGGKVTLMTKPEVGLAKVDRIDPERVQILKREGLGPSGRKS
jgi:hypothetical protein